MHQNLATRGVASETDRSARGLEGLFFFGWTGTMLLLIGGMAAAFFAFGFWWPYWRTADMDAWVVANAFFLNSGLPQETFDHPSYLTFLALAEWFRLLHKVGLLDVYDLTGLPDLSGLPAPADVAGFDRAYTAAVRAGRVLSLGLAIGFVVAFAFLLRRLVDDWRVAALGAFALAWSGGVTIHARIMRSELISAELLIVALLIILIAARRPRMIWRPLLLGTSAALATLALLNKVQSILHIVVLPLIALPFGEYSDDPKGFWRSARTALPTAAVYATAAVIFLIVAAPLLWFGLTAIDQSMFKYTPVAFGLFGVYQPMIVAWIALGIAAFAVAWRVPAAEAVSSLLAALGGAALGLSFLYLRYHPQDVLAAVNPFEHLFLAASVSHQDLAGSQDILSGSLFGKLAAGIGEMLARRTFVLAPSPRPTIVLEWLVIAGIVVAARTGERKLAIQAAVLLTAAWAIDTVGTLRGLANAYIIFTDPLVIIAGALLLAGLKGIQHTRWTFGVGVGLMTLHVVLSMAEPVKQTFRTSRPTELCGPLQATIPQIGPFPFCTTPGI
jgi:hypothetical protein